MPPTDSHLYPHHRPRNTPLEISTSSSLAFTSTLSSLLSTSQTSSRTTAGRQRPSKNKEDIFATHNKNTKKRAAKDLEDADEGRGRPRAGGGGDPVEEEALHRSKRKLEQKAKRYRDLKRGDEAGAEGEALVDFDRKWAEREDARDGASSPSLPSSEDEGHDNQNEIIDYEDEYGRARRGTRLEAARVSKRLRNKLLGAEELDRMSARPSMPQNLIYGDTVQTLAFNPDASTHTKMSDLARKRDRSLTPPEKQHYEADKEFRIKGVGFYSFSKDEELRGREMEALERERLETERVRREREDKKVARKREIEDRRRLLGEKRAKRQADAFLDGLGGDLGREVG